MSTLTLSTINEKLKELGHSEILAKAKGTHTANTICFYFFGGTTEKWASNIVNVSGINDLTLDEWVEAHKKLSENLYITHLTNRGK